jgi:hypothetical protein
MFSLFSYIFSYFLQQVVELEGYVIILVEGRDGKIKLYGSPADRDGLEVADEILDVNERKLDDVPRALVIKHIHEVGFKLEVSSFLLTLSLKQNININSVFLTLLVHSILHDKASCQTTKRLKTR